MDTATETPAMNILVSGAGVAGLAAALELGSRGHHVTVIERASDLRLKGTPIDIRGDALSVIDTLGLRDQIHERRVRMTEQVEFVDADGEPVGRVPVQEINDSADDLEIAREDLVLVLAGALPETAAIRFDDSVTSLVDDGDGADVTLSSGHTGRYDLVLGADGQHSQVRKLAFGPERDYSHPLGVYVALADFPAAAHPHRANPMYSLPGRGAGIARYKDKALAIFNFDSEPIDYDHHDVQQQQQILVDAFDDVTSWRVPELLDAARADPALYFDSVSQIHMPGWHQGRVALLGDAAHCATLLSGRGTSLALTGAAFIAEELERAGNDHTTAFPRYEDRQRPYVTFAQDSVGDGRNLLTPPTWEAIEARNARLLPVHA